MMSAGDKVASGDSMRSSRSIRSNRSAVFNPGFNVYKTKDGKWLQLLGLEAGRHLPLLLDVMGLGEMRKEEKYGPEIVKLLRNRKEVILTLTLTLRNRKDVTDPYS